MKVVSSVSFFLSFFLSLFPSFFSFFIYFFKGEFHRNFSEGANTLAMMSYTCGLTIQLSVKLFLRKKAITFIALSRIGALFNLFLYFIYFFLVLEISRFFCLLNVKILLDTHEPFECTLFQNYIALIDNQNSTHHPFQSVFI